MKRCNTQGVYFVVPPRITAVTKVLSHRKPVSIGNLLSVSQMQFNLAYFTYVSKYQPPASKVALNFLQLFFDKQQNSCM